MKAAGRATLALAGMMWLIAAGAPCVMAQTPDPVPAPSHCPEHAKHIHHNAGAAMPDCGPLTTINCQLPGDGTPLAAGVGDLTITPVLLATLPVPVMLSDSGRSPRHDWLAPDIPAPPLHIQHLTLIL